MFKVWYKATFSAFLLLLMAINLLYFENIISQVTVGAFIGGDYSNRYFGLKSLYEFFVTGFVDDNTFLVELFERIQTMFTKARQFMVDDWTAFSEAGGVYDLFSFFEAIGNFFKMILGFLMTIAYPVFIIFYYFLAFCWIFMKVVLLFNGKYFVDMPQSPYDVTVVALSQIIR